MAKSLSECRKIPLKLNIGCDLHIIPGWVNADLRADVINAQLGKQEVYHVDMRKKLPLATGSVSAITTSMCLYEIYPHEVMDFLFECHRVIEPYGIMRLTELDIDKLYFPSLFFSNLKIMKAMLSAAGFKPYTSAYNLTLFSDPLICVDRHGHEERAYFCEGVK